MAPVFSMHDGRTTVPLRFDPSGSVFVVFRRPAAADHLVSARFTPEHAATDGAASDLVIVKAEYGDFATQRVADVTAKVADLAKDGTLAVEVENSLAGRDPAFMTIKELRVEYRHGGTTKTARRPSMRCLNCPKAQIACRSARYRSVPERGKPTCGACLAARRR